MVTNAKPIYVCIYIYICMYIYIYIYMYVYLTVHHARFIQQYAKIILGFNETFGMLYQLPI